MSLMLLWVFVVAAVIAAVLVVSVLVVRVRSRPTVASEEYPVAEPAIEIKGGTVIVTLDVRPADRDSSVVRRLVEFTAARVFLSTPEAVEVEVRGATGEVLGRVPRQPEVETGLDLPVHLYEPRARRSVGPDLSRHLGEQFRKAEPPKSAVEDRTPAIAPGTAGDGPQSEQRPAVAERFDLPATVRKLLHDPDDPVDLVRAILEAAGLGPSVDGDLVRIGDRCVLVVQGLGTGAIGREVLNRAYLLIQQVGARTALVIALGYLDLREVRRRQALAPHVMYVGSAGLQRMADAVELGVDPLKFAVAA